MYVARPGEVEYEADDISSEFRPGAETGESVVDALLVIFLAVVILFVLVRLL